MPMRQMLVTQTSLPCVSVGLSGVKTTHLDPAHSVPTQEVFW
jgi:hypothetical protein